MGSLGGEHTAPKYRLYPESARKGRSGSGLRIGLGADPVTGVRFPGLYYKPPVGKKIPHVPNVTTGCPGPCHRGTCALVQSARYGYKRDIVVSGHRCANFRILSTRSPQVWPVSK